MCSAYRNWWIQWHNKYYMAGCTVYRSGCQINEIIAELIPPTHQPVNAKQRRAEQWRHACVCPSRFGDGDSPSSDCHPSHCRDLPLKVWSCSTSRRWWGSTCLSSPAVRTTTLWRPPLEPCRTSLRDSGPWVDDGFLSTFSSSSASFINPKDWGIFIFMKLEGELFAHEKEICFRAPHEEQLI